MKFKRGISEAVSYILLILVAIILAVLVYAFLRPFVPNEAKQCENEIALSLSNYACFQSANKLSITLTNKGFFKVDSIHVRIQDSSGLFVDIDDEQPLSLGHDGLKPGESKQAVFVSEHINFDRNFYYIEIEPVIKKRGEYIYCDSAVIRRELSCSLS